MKIYIFIILSVFSMRSFTQSFYYQKDHKTFIDGEKIFVNINEEMFEIFNGICSKEGDYLAGFLVDKNLAEYIESLDSEGIIENIAPKSNRLVIYSLVDSQVIFTKKIEFLPKIYLSNDNLFINYLNNIEIIDIHKKKLKYHTQNKDYSNEFRFYNGYLYLFSRNDESFKIERYDNITNGFSEFSIIDIVNSDVFFIEENNLFLHQDKDSMNIITVEQFNKKIKDFCFDKINYFICDDEIFLVGNFKAQKTSLFRFNKKIWDFEELFPLFDQGDLMDSFISQISSVFSIGDSIFFLIRSLLDENEDIFIFDNNSKTFNNYTQSGFISSPIGYFHRK